ncbi:hypothetical protein HPB50_015339 [Hyalomma asiaticum]|uniref:Uncharacterized protein n=1 Tax=Hyalomma asiaticum TaxID=266040 RepID=A0ACB7SW88_HYAAI|nr:hypothetical protein HPB50_015339 [Hyalomma asiaticum]
MQETSLTQPPVAWVAVVAAISGKLDVVTRLWRAWSIVADEIFVCGRFSLDRRLIPHPSISTENVLAYLDECDESNRPSDVRAVGAEQTPVDLADGAERKRRTELHASSRFVRTVRHKTAPLSPGCAASSGAAGAHVRESSEILGPRSTGAPGKSGRRSRTRDGRQASLAATRSRLLQHRMINFL